MFFRFVILSLMLSQASASTIHLSILNKISAKKTPLVVQDNRPVSIHDLIIQIGAHRKDQDPFDGVIDWADVTVLLDQDKDEPVVLYQGELCSSPRYPQAPLEHPIYDILLDRIEE